MRPSTTQKVDTRIFKSESPTTSTIFSNRDAVLNWPGPALQVGRQRHQARRCEAAACPPRQDLVGRHDHQQGVHDQPAGHVQLLRPLVQRRRHPHRRSRTRSAAASATPRATSACTYCHEALHLKDKLQKAGYEAKTVKWDFDSDSTDESDDEKDLMQWARACCDERAASEARGRGRRKGTGRVVTSHGWLYPLTYRRIGY